MCGLSSQRDHDHLWRYGVFSISTPMVLALYAQIKTKQKQLNKNKVE